MLDEIKVFKKNRLSGINYCKVNGNHELIRNYGKCSFCGEKTKSKICPKCSCCTACGKPIRK